MMTRAQAVEEAKSWLGTPYVLKGRIKQSGADCFTLLAGYLENIGGGTLEKLPTYRADWFLHTTTNGYLREILKLAKLVGEGICNGHIENAQPGDIMLIKHKDNSDLFTHGVILVDFPKAIHELQPKATYCNVLTHPLTAFKPYAIFNPWAVGDSHLEVADV